MFSKKILTIRPFRIEQDKMFLKKAITRLPLRKEQNTSLIFRYLDQT